MPLLNYTTSIDAPKTIGEIQRILARFGARSVTVGYDAGGRPDSLSFEADSMFGVRAFRLPANLDAVEATLKAQARAGKVRRSLATRDQAARVGWRILKDWIEAQLAILESGMVRFDEIMLPYMLGQGGETVYRAMVDHHLRKLDKPAGPEP